MAERGAILPREFYARDALDVARDVLGQHVRHGDVILRITEVEAYRGPSDTAAHARFGSTPRTRTLFGPIGHAYVYLCYGMHWMLNLVARGDGSAVLIRAAEPVSGLASIRERRGGKDGPILLTGPGKIASALGVERRHDGACLYDPDSPITVVRGVRPKEILAGPRVGIDYADPQHVVAPWRLAIGGTAWISQPKSMSPLTEAVRKQRRRR